MLMKTMQNLSISITYNTVPYYGGLNQYLGEIKYNYTLLQEDLRLKCNWEQISLINSARYFLMLHNMHHYSFKLAHLPKAM